MRLFYLDASVLAKRYAREQGSVLVNEMMQRLPPEEMTSPTIGVLEIVSILVRKRNDHRLSKDLFAQAMINLRAETIDNEAFETVSITEPQVLSAMGFIEKHNLNATDAMILRSLMDISGKTDPESDQVVLWTSDQRLERAATSEGIVVFNPKLKTQADLHTLLST